MFKIIIFILFLYSGALLYLYFTQDGKIFNFSTVPKRKPDVLKECPNCKEIKIKTDGISLDGVYKDENSSKLIIYFGGNSDDATDFIKSLKDEKKFDIVVFNYRGDGLSEGKPTEKTLFKDSLSIYDKFKKNKEVILIGRSLGSGVATYLASKRDVKKLFLITPYDSIENVAKQRYPFFPISFLIKYKFKSYKYIEKVKAPVFIFMVKNDKTVSNQRTNNLIHYIKSNYYIKEFDHTTHANILSNENFIEVLKKSL